MTLYLIVEVGCIECGDPTVIRPLTSELPTDVSRVVEPGESVDVGYSDNVIAIPVAPEAHNPSTSPSPKGMP